MRDGRFFTIRPTPDPWPDVGQQCPVFNTKDIHGMPVVVGRTLVAGRATLLMFMDTDTAVNARLMTAVAAVAAREGVDVMLISRDAEGRGDPQGSTDMGMASGRDGIRHVMSDDISQRFGVDRQPCGVLLDAQGVIIAKGQCTTRKHVENLFGTQRRGYYSLYGYLNRISCYARPVYGLR